MYLSCLEPNGEQVWNERSRNTPRARKQGCVEEPTTCTEKRSSLNNTWTWLRYRRTDPSSSSPAPPSEGGPSSYLSLAIPTAGEYNEDGANTADLVYGGEGNLTAVHRTNHPLQNCHASHSGFSVQQRGLLPAPVVQSSSIGSNAPRSAYTKNIKRFLMQEIDGSCASAPLTAPCFMTGFEYVTAITQHTCSLQRFFCVQRRNQRLGHFRLACIPNSLEVHSPLSSHRFIH